MIHEWIKKHRVLTVLPVLLLYLVIGAAAPSYHYKPVSGITKAHVAAADFYQDSPGCDRAMVLKTNQSTWEGSFPKNAQTSPIAFEEWLLQMII